MIKVGFVISLDTSWQGGLNYFKNLFNSVYSLQNRQLDLIIFTGTKDTDLILDGFPIVQVIASTVFDRYSLLWWVRKFFQKLFCKDIILWFLIYQHKIDLLSHFNEKVLIKNIPVIAWIPDFQHLHLPSFFTQKELARRNKVFKQQLDYASAVLVSSNNALLDLKAFYPEHVTKTHVLRFTPNLPRLTDLLSYEQVSTKYKLNKHWFHLPNQFWAHKNHEVVLEALKLLKNRGFEVLVVATGGTSDYRNVKYFPNLINRIKKYGLDNNFLILGVIPYIDMLSILRHSVAVINPSLFEGWSSTVEESKAIGKSIILSDIPVHREQFPKRAHYFSTDSSEKLAEIMLGTINSYDASYEREVEIEAQKEVSANIILFAEAYQKTVLETLNYE